MATNGIFGTEELRDMGLTVGENVAIDRSVRLFNPQNIRIGSDVRIDCFALITAGAPVVIGNFVHIGAASHLFGTGGIEIEDYAGLSSRVSLFTTNEDYLGGHLTNPTVPDAFRQVSKAPIRLRRHAIVGCGTVIMPGVTVGFGAAVGALSQVRRDVADYAVMSGNPLRKVAERDAARLREMEAAHQASITGDK